MNRAADGGHSPILAGLLAGLNSSLAVIVTTTDAATPRLAGLRAARATAARQIACRGNREEGCHTHSFVSLTGFLFLLSLLRQGKRLYGALPSPGTLRHDASRALRTPGHRERGRQPGALRTSTRHSVVSRWVCARSGRAGTGGSSIALHSSETSLCRGSGWLALVSNRHSPAP